MTNPLRALHDHGQSVWLDFIKKSLYRSGELARLVDEDGLRGMTSNPAIFEKAIGGSSEYAPEIAEARARGESDAKAVYERIAVADIQAAADALRGVWDSSVGRDGFVSLEVSPLLARDTAGTLEEARRLWAWVDRPNVMIKVPATTEGLPAIAELIADGISVNVTLLFSVDRYEAVVGAWLSGLEARAQRGLDLSRVASVASFFISRIDSLVDRRLEAEVIPTHGAARELLGQAAIANAKRAYQSYLALLRWTRWHALLQKGAQPQRLLWASTSTKNPAYRDVAYVEELIGCDTVNTMPPETLAAFRDHGRLAPRVTAELDRANDILFRLEVHGLAMRAVTDQLLDEGVTLFEQAFVKLLSTVESRLRSDG